MPQWIFPGLSVPEPKSAFVSGSVSLSSRGSVAQLDRASASEAEASREPSPRHALKWTKASPTVIKRTRLPHGLPQPLGSHDTGPPVVPSVSAGDWLRIRRLFDQADSDGLLRRVFRVEVERAQPRGDWMLASHPAEPLAEALPWRLAPLRPAQGVRQTPSVTYDSTFRDAQRKGAPPALLVERDIVIPARCRCGEPAEFRAGWVPTESAGEPAEWFELCEGCSMLLTSEAALTPRRARAYVARPGFVLR